MNDATIPTGESRSHAVEPGMKLNFYNQNPQGVELVIQGSDGLSVRVNVPVGQRVEITAGAADIETSIYPFNPDLVGVPDPDDVT